MVGSAAGDQGDAAGARAQLDEALALFRALGDRWGVTVVLRELMVVAQRRGDAAAVAGLAHECLRLLRALGTRLGAADCYARLAWAAPARATGAGGAPPGGGGDHDAVVAAVGAALGEAALAAAFAEGQALSLDEALAYALEAAPVPS